MKLTKSISALAFGAVLTVSPFPASAQMLGGLLGGSGSGGLLGGNGILGDNGLVDIGGSGNALINVGSGSASNEGLVNLGLGNGGGSGSNILDVNVLGGGGDAPPLANVSVGSGGANGLLDVGVGLNLGTSRPGQPGQPGQPGAPGQPGLPGQPGGGGGTISISNASARLRMMVQMLQARTWQQFIRGNAVCLPAGTSIAMVGGWLSQSEMAQFNQVLAQYAGDIQTLRQMMARCTTAQGRALLAQIDVNRVIGVGYQDGQLVVYLL